MRNDLRFDFQKFFIAFLSNCMFVFSTFFLLLLLVIVMTVELVVVIVAVLGAPVAQWVQRWPTDLAVQTVRAHSRRNLLNCKRDSSAHSLSLSSAHRPDMTEILLKRT